MTTKNVPTRKEMKKEFKRHLMAARLEAGISQIKLAKLTGISNSTISNYEVGKTLPDEKNLTKIAKVLPALAAHIKKAASSAPTSTPTKKASLIEEARVTTDQAKVAFMKTLVSASQELKDLKAKAESAGISSSDAAAMLKELGVTLA